LESKWRQNWFDLGLADFVPFGGTGARGKGLLARKLTGIGAGVYFVGPVTEYGSAYWWDFLGLGLATPVPLYDPPPAGPFPFGYEVEPDS